MPPLPFPFVLVIIETGSFCVSVSYEDAVNIFLFSWCYAFFAIAANIVRAVPEVPDERTSNPCNIGCQYFVERMFHSVSYAYNTVCLVVVTVFSTVNRRIYALYNFLFIDVFTCNYLVQARLCFLACCVLA